MSQREFDVVLHGATGFVGRLTAAHLATHGGEARIAISGRSQGKLEALRDALGVDWPVVVVDSHDDAALTALARSTTAVATTVGPYLTYGMPLVRACAGAGTAYADLTGEVLFVRESAAELHAVAQGTSARIVHSTGFDSVPSDLGVHLLRERVTSDGEGDLEETVLVLVSASGGFSGGTIDSLRTQIDEVAADRSLGAVVADPYSLSPDLAGESDVGRVLDGRRPMRDPLLGRWVAPFVMGPFNTRIVRRSNALQGFTYGPGFAYREVMGVGSSPAAPILAGAITLGLGAVVAGMSFAPTRALLDRILPSPGEGPAEKARVGGHFRVEVHTRTSTGARYVATVAASGDPGYAATSVMIGESVLSLALDDDGGAGGVLTPAVALGDRLVDRLRARGFEMSVARI
jgi:short subunit dehydrogenase-like uncharacterized protein